MQPVALIQSCTPWLQPAILAQKGAPSCVKFVMAGCDDGV